MWVIATMSIVFEEALKSQWITKIQIWLAIWLLFEIGVNFVRITDGKGYYKLEKVREIAEEYVRSKFGLDLICWIALIFDIAFEFQLTVIFRVIMILKLPGYLEKI